MEFQLGAVETALLLRACQTEARSRGPSLPVAAGALDWKRLSAAAASLGAAPALLRELEHATDGGPLPAGAQVLRTMAAWQELREVHQRRVLERVARELIGAGYEIVLLKGAAFLALAMQSGRQMGDLDILVPSHAEDAWHFLRSEGWRTLSERHTLDAYSSHHHLPALLDPKGSDVAVEIHRNIVPAADRLGLPDREVLSRARRVTLGGTVVLVPCAEHMLFHTALHFAWCNEMGSGWWRAFADTHAIVGDSTFSWQRFVDLVSGTSGRTACWWTLELARTMTGLAVPEDVQRVLAPEGRSLERRFLVRHFVTLLTRIGSERVPLKWRRRLWERALKPDRSGLLGLRPWQWSVRAIEKTDVRRPQHSKFRRLLRYCRALLSSRIVPPLELPERSREKASGQR
ncbi:MAG TPA: nucleotidyltransferase family protein [Gemmatimonadaceae bacterium]|nr:nucleotidyltransferase family protein [Gemmatimonadaceae bacterium]